MNLPVVCAPCAACGYCPHSRVRQLWIGNICATRQKTYKKLKLGWNKGWRITCRPIGSLKMLTAGGDINVHSRPGVQHVFSRTPAVSLSPR
jgi:hypothetical protein